MKSLKEAYQRTGDSVYESDPSDLMEFAAAYAKLGGAVQEQLGILLSGNPDDMYDINPNAVEMIKSELNGFNAELDTAIEEYFVMLDDRAEL